MQDFKFLHVMYNERSKYPRTLFMKAHSVREMVSEKPKDRTIFLVGVPQYYTEETFKALFGSYGTVLAVYFNKNPTVQAPKRESSTFFPKDPPIQGFKVAYVVFAKPEELIKVLEIEETLILPSDCISAGMKKWMIQYNSEVPNAALLGTEIKDFMNKFDSETVKKAEIDKKLREEDDEGWITVTKSGKRPGFARKENVRDHLKKKYEKQRKKQELKDFYTFQIKESKMKNLMMLRKKFEEDKKKIAALKQTRRFKPF